MALFYRKALLCVSVLLILSAILLYAGLLFSIHETAFLPHEHSDINWFYGTEPPDQQQGDKVFVLNSGETSQPITFDFLVSTEERYPYTSFIVNLSEPQDVSDLVDLSVYSRVSFGVKCEPKNILVFALYTYVDNVTTLGKPETYRVSLDFLTCNKQSSRISFELKDLDSADWWLERYGLAYTDRTADLRRTHGFSINNSLQSPRGSRSRIEISDLVLVSENYSYFGCSVAITAVAWLALAYFFMRLYVQEKIRRAKEQINMNRPLIAYQKLSIKQQSDDPKSALLSHIAVEYINPEINIESAAATLGTTRSKINKILKAELGLTFTAYVNKLRLAEAARLLIEEQHLSVKQIALGVGFANVTYFNALFKKEYGCAPKTFRLNSFKTPEA
ncbi:AraC family transcriptional regulator [Gynuella sunshinyii]|uniref:AraC-type DNA-binding domain-containing protein n=1 Tax=Gynuella sunshinyii YC6258 TaxID=1445510 RepID=A0A0C5VLL7_9GAMM|nr:helix-turn-helix domain-containing protein [Gynuella sunshinyii]AJQ95612.1 araC-type DNA-binding domain-containing protein [Gynuella sunshinyii YC6258]